MRGNEHTNQRQRIGQKKLKEVRGGNWGKTDQGTKCKGEKWAWGYSLSRKRSLVKAECP